MGREWGRNHPQLWLSAHGLLCVGWSMSALPAADGSLCGAKLSFDEGEIAKKQKEEKKG